MICVPINLSIWNQHWEHICYINKSIVLWWEFIGCNKYWRISKFDQFDFDIWWACFNEIRVIKICNLSFFEVLKYLFLFLSSKARSRHNKIKHSTPIKSLDIFNRNNHPYSPYIFLPCYFNSSYGESVSKALILVIKTYLNTSKLLVLIEKKNSTNTSLVFVSFLFWGLGEFILVYGQNGSKKSWFLVCNLKHRRMLKHLHINIWFIPILG